LQTIYFLLHFNTFETAFYIPKTYTKMCNAYHSNCDIYLNNNKTTNINFIQQLYL